MRIFTRLFLIIIFIFIASVVQAKDIYYCPMHTNYTSDKPGSCPICGMTLVKKMDDADKVKTSGLAGHATVRLNPDQQGLIGITTVKAHREALKRHLRASGYVSTLHDLVVMQDSYVKAYIEYAQVFREQQRFQGTRRNWESHRDVQLRMHAAEEELLKLGFNEQQMTNLQKYSWKTPWNQPELNFIKDGVNYWVVAALYEQDLGYVEVGQTVDLEIPAYHEHLKGVIRTVGRVIDPATRTVNALIEIQNYRGELVGNMFVNVSIDVVLNEYVIVPQNALLDTGLRKVVYVETKPGMFTPQEVSKAIAGDNGWGIVDGINEGDIVVTEGNFLLDSESRMQASLGGQDHD